MGQALLSGIRRQILIRLAACGVLFALIAGSASYVVETNRLDRLVHMMALQEATRLAHSMMDQGRTPMGQSAINTGNFLFARVMASGEDRQVREVPGLSEPLRIRLRQLLEDDRSGTRHVNFRQDGRSFVFLSFDTEDDHRRFAGLYRVDEALEKSMSRQMLWSVLGVFAVVALSTGTLIPILLTLEGKVLRHARDAVDANVDALVTMGGAIAQRDSDTDAHNYRVTLCAIRLAERLGVDDETVRQLVRGAFLHDVGKIGVPDAILLKPGRLTSDEFAIMQSHVRRGLEIVARSRWLVPATEVIGGHHEKFDGTGYPHGLSGTDIPLTARIFAVVDVFDALTSKRPYKEAYDLDRACEVMSAGRGQHFDPKILDSFLEMAPDLYAEHCIADDSCARQNLEGELRKRFG